MKALLLAGGRATRLHPFTDTRPKPLLPIAGRPILESNLEQLRKAGVTTVVLVTAPGDDSIRARFGDGSDLGLSIEYVRQDGDSIGSAILSARKKFVTGQYFLLVYADILTTENIFSNALSIFNRMRAPVASVCLTDNSSQLYGNVYLDESMRIMRIEEKPDRTGMGNYVLGGVFVFPFDIFTLLDEAQGSVLGAFESLIGKFGLFAAIWEKAWIDINYPWSILQANKIVMDTWTVSEIAGDVDLAGNVTIHGPVRIESGVRICEGAVIRGPVLIGRGSFIGNNALVREYSAVGPGTQVGFGTELKNCIIFGGADIGRISYIGDSVVGEGARIGSCTMTINLRLDGGTVKIPVKGEIIDSGLEKLGAFIGDGAVIGASNTIQAGAVIDAGDIIGDHFTVGKRER
jgi:UDP-N-acetylglucosamine diphosphorylase/glucosamine-1-phosphate N-acetyltransferase